MRLWLLAYCVCTLGWGSIRAQEEFTIDDGGSSNCTGFLTDSGGAGGNYTANESASFVVDLGENIPISITFLENVCLESPFDVLTIYDGTLSNGTLLAEITGIDFTPSPLMALSGTVTFAFQSDVSVNYCGFNLLWEGIAPEPTAPSVIADPIACGDLGITWQIDPPIPCAALVSDSVQVFSGMALGMAEPICSGDSATGFFTPFSDGAIAANCFWEIGWGLGLTDACDSTHVFFVEAQVEHTTCPVSGAWIEPVTALCAGECDTLWWAPNGCYGASWVWTQTNGATVVDTPDSAGVVVCPDNGSVTVTLVATEATSGAVTAFSWEVGLETVQLLTDLPEALCTGGSQSLELIALPDGGEWSGTVVEASGSWWLDAEAAASNDGIADLTYTSPLGCTLDTLVQLVVVNAGGPYATCVGAPAFEAEGDFTGESGIWSGQIITPTGTIVPSLPGTFDIELTSSGCSDVATVEVIELLPTIELGEVCGNAEPFTLPVISDAGLWSGPGLNPSAVAFDPTALPEGPSTWQCELIGCAQPATAYILPIIGAEPFTACPDGDVVQITDASPAGGTWSGPGMSPSGVFNPAAAGEGQHLVNYLAPNGCTAGTTINNITTALNQDSLATCTGSNPYALEGVPNCGDWSGSWGMDGLTSGCNAELNPSVLNAGTYALTYSANGCSANMQLVVWPASIAIPEVAVCNNAAPIDLAPADLALGGTWSGLGVDPVTGLFQPSQASPTGAVSYVAPGGCISSAILIAEPWQQVAPTVAIPDTLCPGTELSPAWIPSDGSYWYWDGIPGLPVDADTLAPGTYTLSAQWEGTYCSSDMSVDVVVLTPLSIEILLDDDLICAGQSIEATYSGSGGNPVAYDWNFSDTTPWMPAQSTWWSAELTDGCSAPATDSLWIQVVDPQHLNFVTPDTACFEGNADVVATIAPSVAWELTWEGALTLPEDVLGDTTWWELDAIAGSTVNWALEWPEEGCMASGAYVVPTYAEVTTDVSWPQDCVPWDQLPVALVNDGGGATLEEWWFREPGTGVILSQTTGPIAQWSPDQPGEVLVQLTASIDGQCSLSTANLLCVLAPRQWFLPDRFSPNGDGLNDHLGVRSHPLSSFRMRVLNGWGELVAELSNPQPGWDGSHREVPAPSGVYVVQLEMEFTDGTSVATHQHVTLVR